MIGALDKIDENTTESMEMGDYLELTGDEFWDDMSGDKLDEDKCGLFEAFNPNLSHLMAFFPGLLPGEHFIKPKTGLMNLFPSYLRHGVRTYYGDNPRICIAINASMKIKTP